MKPFKSAADMIAIHEGMFGDAGRSPRACCTGRRSCSRPRLIR